MRQGETFTITPELYAETLDRNGDSVLNLNEAEQTQRYGRVLWSEGEPPEGMGLGLDDEYVLYRRGIAAREHALEISDPADRREALAEVEKKYGRALRPQAQR